MIKVAFYKAKHGGLVDKLINWWTGRRGYSHVEIVFSNGLSFSASQHTNSCRFTNINLASTKWEVVTLPDINLGQEGKIYLKAKQLEGKRYDWVGIFLHQFLPFNTQSRSKWWCSEVVAHLLEVKPEKVSPNKLHKLLTEG